MNAVVCAPVASIVGHLLLLNAALLVVYMTLAWLVAVWRKRIDTVDGAWGLGFVLVAWAAVIERPVFRTYLIAAIVTVWGVRMTWHLGRRSLTHPEDRRYTELRKKWKGNPWIRAYFSIFLLQGALVWLICLPIVMATNAQLTGWKWLSVLGAIIWAVGFVTESIADYQLKKFRAQKDHPKILQTGLWRYSRHPNYFGELTQWWGIGIIALQASYGWVGLAGPLTLTILILFVSGIPPIEKRHKTDPDYQKYQKQTSVLVPWPPRKRT
ncbi:MAG TPA: DUF1295 domain-containing protein [Candidatus Saccharimonadales bacterium]